MLSEYELITLRFVCRNGDKVSIRLGTDGKGLDIKENHPAGSSAGDDLTNASELVKDEKNN